MKPKRPLLRYPGGKWRIAPWIISHFPPHKYYVEPYGGGGNILLRKPRVVHEVYNDLSSEVVNVFRVMQDPDLADRLIRKLKYTPYSREEYYLSREKVADQVEQARRTIVRTFMGFGSIGCFKTMTGFRSASFYKNRSVAIQWADRNSQLDVFISRLKGVTIENKPALDVIAQQDKKDTLFYIDPPYVKDTRTQRDIYDHEMDDEDHRELAEVLYKVEGMVVLSGYHGTLYEELYKGWEQREKIAYASVHKGVEARLEVLWMNLSCSRELLPLFPEGLNEKR